MQKTGKPDKKETPSVIGQSESPLFTKILYGAVVSILLISAIVTGVVSASSRRKTPALPDPPAESDLNIGDEQQNDLPMQDPEPDREQNTEKETAPTFVSPVVGSVIKAHSDSVPVYSITLEDYRIHKGLDISTEDGAKVYAAAGGEITKVYRDPLLGCAVEIAHSGNLKTVYCNLDAESVADLHEGQTVKSGACIGKVGDSSISECCDEPHLHFEMLVNGSSVNPLDYITAASQKASLGIEIEQA